MTLRTIWEFQCDRCGDVIRREVASNIKPEQFARARNWVMIRAGLPHICPECEKWYQENHDRKATR